MNITVESKGRKSTIPLPKSATVLDLKKEYGKYEDAYPLEFLRG